MINISYIFIDKKALLAQTKRNRVDTSSYPLRVLGFFAS